ncbi:hypothetical protein [Microbulbifer elongatus]|uniref:hypothetical protein n=1 Tax=Microbulbifer elongatus TaxID=86173 RepID=UPI001E42800C|nr:hypothetical protein [Microbulbifer elongatus]
MLNFIKYNRIKLRDLNTPCVPHGPDFLKSKKFSYKFRSSELKFQAPTQHHLFRSGMEQWTPKWKEDELDQLHNSDIYSHDYTWESRIIFQRKYAFFGPWFSGEKARATFVIGVTTPAKPNGKINFLHPKAFEVAISGYLTATVGHLHHDSDGEPYYHGPVSWKPRLDFPVPAVEFKIEDFESHQPDYYLCFAIDKDRIMTVELTYSQHASGSMSEVDAVISPKPAQDLIENIINSVEFSPSPTLEHELAELRKTCPDLSVSKDFPPLKWPATVDETGLNIVELNAERRKALAG